MLILLKTILEELYKTPFQNNNIETGLNQGPI